MANTASKTSKTPAKTVRRTRASQAVHDTMPASPEVPALSAEELAAQADAKFAENLAATGVSFVIDGASYKVSGELAAQFATNQSLVARAYGFFSKAAAEIAQVSNAPACFERPDSTEGKARARFMESCNRRFVEASQTFAAMDKITSRTEAQTAAWYGAAHGVKEARRVVKTAISRLYGYYLAMQTEEGAKRQAVSWTKLTGQWIGKCEAIAKRAEHYTVTERAQAARLAEAIKAVMRGEGLGLTVGAVVGQKITQPETQPAPTATV